MFSYRQIIISLKIQTCTSIFSPKNIKHVYIKKFIKLLLLTAGAYLEGVGWGGSG